MKPLVSVVITSYNYAQYICTAIDSVLSQDYENLEVIVTDNGSTDDTLAVLEKYASEPRFRLNVNEKNLGIVGNINFGIGLARGEYVVVLSADDWLLQGHLSRLVALAEQYPEVGFVYGNAYLCRDDGVPYAVRHVVGQTFLNYAGTREELGWLLAACYMCLPTILFRRELFERFGKFDESFPVACDWEITVRMVTGGVRTAYLAAPVVGVRIHEAQASGRNYVKSGAEFLDHLRILERYYDRTFDRRHGRELRAITTLRGRYDMLKKLAPDQLDDDIAKRTDRMLAALESDRKLRSSRKLPAVTIVVTSTGRMMSLGACLQSISWQTYPNWDVWVVQDQGFEIYGWAAQKIPREKLRYARTPERFGPALVRSQALGVASGDYYLFVDEDTQLAPRHLEELVVAAERAEGVAVSGTIVQFNQMRSEIGWEPVGNTEATYPLRPSSRDLLVASCVPLSAVLFDCTAADELEHFDPALGICADWDFLIRLSKLRSFSYTGTRTLVDHAFLGLSTQALQTHWGSYLPCMDAVYRRHAVADVDMLKEREQHREDVKVALQRGPAAYAQADELFRLYSTLSGSTMLKGAVSTSA